MSSRSGAPRRARRHRPTNRGARTTAPRAVSPLETALDAAARTEVHRVGFAELGVPPKVVTRLQDKGIIEPTEVQCRTIPDALAGRDLLGRAQTGSGKTLAFGLPIVAALARHERPTGPGHPRALVLAPTRELAQQVADAIDSVARAYALSVLPIYGGASMDRQLRALRRGVDIVVATPGRLEDHMKRGTCSLSRVDMFVIDEADHMADLGFLPAVTRIISAIPDSAQRLLFSATLDRGIERLASRYLRDPAIHAASVGTPSAGTMAHRAFAVAPADKIDVAAQVAERHGRTLFFVRTKHGADRLARQLRQRGIESGSIHATAASPSVSVPWRSSPPDGDPCWSRRMSPPVGSTSTRSTSSSTSIHPPITRTTCTAVGAPLVRVEPDWCCRYSCPTNNATTNACTSGRIPRTPQ